MECGFVSLPFMLIKLLNFPAFLRFCWSQGIYILSLCLSFDVSAEVSGKGLLQKSASFGVNVVAIRVACHVCLQFRINP